MLLVKCTVSHFSFIIIHYFGWFLTLCFWQGSAWRVNRAVPPWKWFFFVSPEAAIHKKMNGYGWTTWGIVLVLALVLATFKVSIIKLFCQLFRLKSCRGYFSITFQMRKCIEKDSKTAFTWEKPFKILEKMRKTGTPERTTGNGVPRLDTSEWSFRNVANEPESFQTLEEYLISWNKHHLKNGVWKINYPDNDYTFFGGGKSLNDILTPKITQKTAAHFFDRLHLGSHLARLYSRRLRWLKPHSFTFAQNEKMIQFSGGGC